MAGSFSISVARARCRLKPLVAVCRYSALRYKDTVFRTSVLALSAEGESCSCRVGAVSSTRLAREEEEGTGVLDGWSLWCAPS
jgi:hypothetical protein